MIIKLCPAPNTKRVLEILKWWINQIMCVLLKSGWKRRPIGRKALHVLAFEDRVADGALDMEGREAGGWERPARGPGAASPKRETQMRGGGLLEGFC